MPNESIKPYIPTRRFRAAMGDIVMIGAEIDHLVSLALFKLISLDFSAGFTMFDRASIGTKLAKLRYFMEWHHDEAVDAYKVLDTKLASFLKLRNTVAHGNIVGTRDGRVVFLLTADFTDNLGSYTSSAIGYSEEEMASGIANGRECINDIKNIFSVQLIHEAIDYAVLVEKPTTLKSQRKSRAKKDLQV